MAENILKLKVDSTEYEGKIKRASAGILDLGQSLQKAGKSFVDADEYQVAFIKELGQMNTVSRAAKGRVSELSAAFIDLSTQYKRMTDQEKSSPVGQAMAASLEQLKQRTIDAKNELKGLEDQLRGVGDVKMPDTGGGIFSGDKLSGMMQVFGGNLMTKGFELTTGAVTNLVSEVGSCITQGIELARQGEGIRNAFERLGRGDILNGLREATHGTVTDLELMKAAVKFNDFKLPIEELGTMLAFAQQKAKDTGQSVDYMVDSIVTGLGRKSLMILDNLGLSAAEIKDKMAETGDMTKAVGAIIREQMQKAGDYVETAADRAAQANVSLQNKMEELGRKFAPVEEASNQLWTSMKIGILDIVGGPLARLLNGLTEAGRLRNMLDQVNGGNNGQPSRVSQQLNELRGSNYKGVKYFSQLAQYDKDIRDAVKFRKQYENAGMAGGAVLSDVSRRFNVKVGGAEDIDNLIYSLQQARSEYKKAGKEIVQPIEVNINTDSAEQNIDTLKAKLKDLQEQRKKAIAAGDSDLSKNLLQQINQLKADIKGLDPNALTTSGTDPVKQAADRVANAQHEYQQSIEMAKMSLDNGTVTETDYKKKLLAAEERLWNALGDAYNVHADPSYKQAQDECAKKIKELGGEVTASIEAQKRTQEAARQLEQAQKKLADAEQRLADAQKTGSPTAVFKAMKDLTKQRNETERTDFAGKAKQGVVTELPDGLKVEVVVEVNDSEALSKLSDINNITFDPATLTVTTDDKQAWAELQKINGLKLDPKTVKVTTETNMSSFEALKENIKEQLKLDQMTVDENTLRSLLQTAIQNGLEGLTVDYEGLQKKIAQGIDIPESTWKELQDEINAKLKEMGIEPIIINFETGGIDKVKEGANDTAKAMRTAASAISTVGSALSSIEDPAAKIAGIVGQAIATVASAFAQAMEMDWGNKSNIYAFIGAAAAATASMISTISAIHSATGYAQGGEIKGNHYSGDNIGGLVDGSQLVGLNAGEIVLTRAMTGNLASQLQEGGGGGGSTAMQPYVSGENIFLGMSNFTRKKGYGDIVTTSTLRRLGLM